MAAERAAYANLNAVAAEREANLASMEAAQLAVLDELRRARVARAADERANLRRAESTLRRERRVHSRLRAAQDAPVGQDGEAGQGGLDGV